MVAYDIRGIALNMYDAAASSFSAAHQYNLYFIEIRKPLTGICVDDAARLAIFKALIQRQPLQIKRHKKIRDIEIVGHEEDLRTNL